MAKPSNRRNVRKAKNARVDAAEGFWDRPALMNLVSDLLLVFGFAVLAWAAVSGLKRLPFNPLRELVVQGEVGRVSRAQLEHVARSSLSGNLLSVNLDEARAAFEKLPWVRHVELRRRWPDALELSLEEHVAVARWSRIAGESGDMPEQLVNDRGEVFAATADDELPSFAGPEGSAAAMLARYREFSRELATVGRTPAALTLSAREAWQIRLDDGVLLDLGRDQAKHPLKERLARFVGHYPAARDKLRQPVAAVDMRYPNGFALRVGAPERKSKQS